MTPTTAKLLLSACLFLGGMETGVYLNFQPPAQVTNSAECTVVRNVPIYLPTKLKPTVGIHGKMADAVQLSAVIASRNAMPVAWRK